MAFVMEFATGFETGKPPVCAAAILQNQTAFHAQTDAAHTGSYSLGPSLNNQKWIVQMPTPRAEFYAALWVKTVTTASQIYFYDGVSTPLVSLVYDGACWDAKVGSSVVAHGAVTTTGANWQHIQLHVVIDDTDGVIETIVDGIPDITYAGDTKPSAASTMTHFVVHFNTDMRIDDVVVGYGGWPGDWRFALIAPTSDVAAGFSRSEGDANYKTVDERPPSSADWNFTTVNASDRYGTAGDWDDTDGLGNVIKDPMAVILWADARKQDGNGDDTLRLALSDGTNTVTGEYESLLTSYENRWLVQKTAPDGGEWTTAKINALILGIDGKMARA